MHGYAVVLVSTGEAVWAFAKDLVFAEYAQVVILPRVVVA